jgi:hypothetical protein
MKEMFYRLDCFPSLTNDRPKELRTRRRDIYPETSVLVPLDRHVPVSVAEKGINDNVQFGLDLRFRFHLTL